MNPDMYPFFPGLHPLLHPTFRVPRVRPRVHGSREDLPDALPHPADPRSPGGLHLVHGRTRHRALRHRLPSVRQIQVGKRIEGALKGKPPLDLPSINSKNNDNIRRGWHSTAA